MTLRPGEAAVLIIRRGEKEPARYLVPLRLVEASFAPKTNDLLLHGFQVAAAELGQKTDFGAAMTKGVAMIERIEL